MNVLLTRAKCLMIIIGDPNTLKLDKNWRQVLMRFKKTGVCTGETFDFKWQAIESSGSKEINDKNPKSTFTVDLQIKQESKYNRIHDSITMYKSASTSATQQAGSTTRSSTTASSSSSSNMLPLKNHKSVAITSDSSIKPMSSTIRTALRTTVPTSTASTPTLTRNAPSINKVDFTYSGKNVSSVRTLPTNSLASNWAASTSAWVDNEIRYVRNAQNDSSIKPIPFTIRTALRATVPTRDPLSQPAASALTRNAPTINQSVRALPINSLASNGTTSALVDNEIRFRNSTTSQNTYNWSHNEFRAASTQRNLTPPNVPKKPWLCCQIL